MTYTYDARDELTGNGTNTYTYTARGTPSSESAPAGTVAVTFDAYGDQASAGARSYGYDALGRVTSDVATATGTGYGFSYAGKTGTIASEKKPKVCRITRRSRRGRSRSWSTRWARRCRLMRARGKAGV